MLKEILVLVDVQLHTQGNLGIGGATQVYRGRSCSPVQAKLGCDGRSWGRGELGWWTREANNSLRSARFCLSCRELKCCKARPAAAAGIRIYRDVRSLQKKKSGGGKKTL